MAFLVYEGPDGHTVRRLEGDTTIGRSDDSDITLADGRVSKHHASLSSRDGRWVFEDLDSTNGSQINDEPVASRTLEDGDVIRLGHAELTFRVSLEAPGDGNARRLEDSWVTSARQSATHLEDFFRDDPGMTTVSSVRSDDERVRTGGHADDPGMLFGRLRVCYEISRATAATVDLAEILDRVLSALFEIFEAAEHAFVFLVDPETKLVASAASKSREGRGTDIISISRTALQQAMDNHEAVLCSDAMTDQRLASAQSVVSLGIRSLMIAPLVFQEDVLGAIHVDTRHATGQFTTGDLQLLSAAAAQVAGAVANALLHEKVVASERLAAVGQTVAGLTHCIKNIMQGVKGGAFIVEKALKSGNDDQLAAGWDMVRRNSAFMEELVFDLLSLSKDRVPEYESCDLNAIANDVCTMAAARAQSKDVSVAFHADSGLEPLQVDPRGLKRSLLNLVTNAIDACAGSKGTVTVTTAAPGPEGFARIVVRDNGCGMSEETRLKLFAVFFSTKGSKGTGLGLPVTKKIIEEHGGTITVESQQGEGTAFTISLPRERPVGPTERSST